MNTPVLPIEKGYCLIRNIRIENVEVVGADRIFTAAGLSEKMIENVTFSNITAEGNHAGSIEYALNWKLKNVTLKTKSGDAVKVTNSREVSTSEAAQNK